MSLFLHEKTAQKVAARSLVEAMEKQSAFDMDMFARLSVLEGAAGVPPGTWLRKGAKGFGDALEHFGTGLDSTWTSLRNQGLYDKALKSAASIVARKSTLDPADLVQDMLVGSSHSSGPDYKRLFHTVGKKIGKHLDLGAGDGTPRHNSIRGAVDRWVRHYAINQLKKKQNQLTTTFAPGADKGFDPTRSMAAPQLDEEKRQLLVLLALQSPGGPGVELRRIIDRLVDQHFTRSERPIVKVFLQKISSPKYRSPALMRQMVKKFNPKQWLGQAINVVRKEIMKELGVSSQTLTNVLGAKGRNVFRFMREKVGKDRTVRRILEELAQEIDLLEPAVVRMGHDKDSELTEDQIPVQPWEVVQEWIEQTEREDDEEKTLAAPAGPRQEEPFDHAHDMFEMNEYMDWSSEVGPHGVYNRGAVPLRVALENQRLLYRITKLALNNEALRPELLSLIRVDQKARVASAHFDLRSVAIRTAYNASDPDLRHALVQAVVEASSEGLQKQAQQRAPRYRGAFQRWIRNRKFRNEETQNENVFSSLPSEQQSRIYQEWQQHRLEWAQGHKPANLGPETRITLENFDRIRPGDVIWRSDSPVKLHRVTEVDREGWRARNPTLVMVQFDRNAPDQEGEERHLTRSTIRNPMLEYHRVPGMGARAEREQARSQLPTQPKGGWPSFSDLNLGNQRTQRLQDAFKAMRNVRDPREVSAAKIKERLEEALGEAPPPRKAMKEFMHELRDWVSQLAKAAQKGGAPLKQQAQTYRAMKLKLDQGISNLDGDDRRERQQKQERKRNLTPDLNLFPPNIRDRFDEPTRARMQKVLGSAIRRLADGNDLEEQFAKKLVKKLKDAGVDLSFRNGALAFGLLRHALEQVAENVPNEEANRLVDLAQKSAQEGIRRLRDGRNDQHQQEERQRRREEAPAQHRDRKEIRGGGRKQMSHPAKLNSYFIGQLLPAGASDEIKAAAKTQLKQATYEDLERMRKAALYIFDNWDSDFAKNHALVKHLGYDREGLKKLKRLLKRKLGDVNGRRYHDDVLKVANKYDLESEDADALYDWRVDKPARGRALSDQEKFNRFMAKAKPETRERMQNMDLADFMVMYKSILKEVLDEDEELAQAA